MIKIIMGFFKDIFPSFKTFLITFATAILATNNENMIYKILSFFGLENETGKKAMLSATIAIIVAIINSLISQMFKLLKLIMSKYLKKLKIDITFKVNKRKKSNVEFKCNSGQAYSSQKLDIEVVLVPASRLIMLFLELLDVRLELFFNPQILEIVLENDCEWMGERASTKVDDKQTICMDLLNEYRTDGKIKDKSFKRTDSMLIIPKRVRKDTTNIDLEVSSKGMSCLANLMCKLNVQNLEIKCEDA